MADFQGDKVPVAYARLVRFYGKNPEYMRFGEDHAFYPLLSKSSDLLNDGVRDYDSTQYIDRPITGVNGTIDLSTLSLADATIPEVSGDADLDLGFDWEATPQSFIVDGIEVNLTTKTTTQMEIVEAINSKLDTLGLNLIRAQSYSAYQSTIIALRKTVPGAASSFILTEGTGALATLGIEAGTYTGTDAGIRTATITPAKVPADSDVTPTYTYSSSAPSVATVAAGVVTAIAVGTAKITLGISGTRFKKDFDITVVA